MPRKDPHLHRYKRRNLARDGNYIVYACTKPVCYHYIRAELLVGKIAECPRCDKPFQISNASLELAEPHCDECTSSNKREGTSIEA